MRQCRQGNYLHRGFGGDAQNTRGAGSREDPNLSELMTVRELHG